MFHAWIDTLRKFSNYSDFIHAVILILSFFLSLRLFFSPRFSRPHGNGKEFHISRSFKVHSRRIISAWSPLATGIMSELWRHPARCEGLHPLSSFTGINQCVSRYLHRKFDICTENARAGQGSSIVRTRTEKRVESFPRSLRERGEGIGHNDNTGFHFNGRNCRVTDVHAKATAVGYLPVFLLAEKSKQV